MIPYYHVDAFTTALFAGNPAGVCIVPTFPPEQVMQRIAAENRHSETAFVVERADGDFDLRWFTPLIEDDLCGHATLAAAYVLALRGRRAWPVRFHTRSGVLTVARNGDTMQMDFPARPAAACDVPPGLLPALGLSSGKVLKARDYLVIVEDAEAVASIRPDFVALARLDIGIGGTIVTAPGDGDIDYVVRFFCPAVGINEDPATGSISCTLGPYWSARLDKQALRARQLSLRGGELECRVLGDRVQIAGQARLYLQGTIEI